MATDRVSRRQEQQPDQAALERVADSPHFDGTRGRRQAGAAVLEQPTGPDSSKRAGAGMRSLQTVPIGVHPNSGHIGLDCSIRLPVRAVQLGRNLHAGLTKFRFKSRPSGNLGAADMSGFNRDALVLLVDDDARLATLAGDWLERKGFRVDFATCGADALNLTGAQRYDAIILDLDLPDIGGVTVCRRLRETSDPATPIIMLTARTSLDWTLQSLEAGADDYLTKPFSPSELIARLAALMRRSRQEVAAELIELEHVRVDLRDGYVTREGRHINVLPTGVAILATLMRAYPRVVTREELLRRIWGNTFPDSDSLRSHLYQLRRSLNSGFAEPLVETIAGVGLRFRAPRPNETIPDSTPATAFHTDAFPAAESTRVQGQHCHAPEIKQAAAANP